VKRHVTSATLSSNVSALTRTFHRRTLPLSPTSTFQFVQQVT